MSEKYRGELPEDGRKIPNSIQEILDKANPGLSEAVLGLKKLDDVTFHHSVEVAELALRFANEQKFSERDTTDFVIASLLHDVGKKEMKDIITKPGPLTAEERAKRNTHPRLGFEIINKHEPRAAQIAVGHHEHTTRYPRKTNRRGVERAGERRKKDERVEQLSRLLAMLDVFHALRDKSRSYKKEFSLAETRKEMEKDFSQETDKENIDLLMSFVKQS